MKQLTLIRHAKTEVIHSGITDFQRKLKKRGIADAGLIAEYLKEQQFLPDKIISSDATRALQTAQILADSINYPREAIILAPFLYQEFTHVEFLSFIDRHCNQDKSVWVIGHNPDIALLAMTLTNENYFHFPTTATVVIHFESDQWNEIISHSGKSIAYICPNELKNELE